MYLILDSKNLIKEICGKPCYVRRQSNGVVILTERVNADAIYSSETDSFYPVERIGYLCDSHRLVEIENVPENVTAGYWYFDCGQFYTTEAKLKALARAKSPDVAGLIFASMAQEGKFDDTTIAKHAEQFQQWKVNISYSVGDICARDGKLYRCLQAHTSQADWTPDTAVSLFKVIGDPTTEYPEWSQPIGAVDAYAIGDKVSHNAKHWVSTADANAWEPGVYGWEEAA